MPVFLLYFITFYITLDCPHLSKQIMKIQKEFKISFNYQSYFCFSSIIYVKITNIVYNSNYTMQSAFNELFFFMFSQSLKSYPHYYFLIFSLNFSFNYYFYKLTNMKNASLIVKKINLYTNYIFLSNRKILKHTISKKETPIYLYNFLTHRT